MKSTTIEFTRPTTVTVWRQLNERKIRVAAGDQLTGTLYTDHTLENLAGDHHMPAGSYRMVSTVIHHQTREVWWNTVWLLGSSAKVADAADSSHNSVMTTQQILDSIRTLELYLLDNDQEFPCSAELAAIEAGLLNLKSLIWMSSCSELTRLYKWLEIKVVLSIKHHDNIHMINRHTTRTLDTFTRFSWRFWLVCCCTTWLVTYQITTWYEHVRARAFEQRVTSSGLPPIQLINPAPADTPTRLLPALNHLEFTGPSEYFRYLDTRAQHKHQTLKPNRTR